MAGPDLSVVLPTINERSALAVMLPRLETVLAGWAWEAVVVDDGSTDGTTEFVRSRGERYRVLQRPGRLGLASAVLDGIAVARGRWVVVMDADGSHPPERLPALLAPLREGSADLVLASRHRPGGGSPGLSRTRRLVSWGARWLARPLTPTSDPMSGFVAFPRSLLEGHRLEPVGYKIALEVLVRCRPRRLVEVPYVFQARLAGSSKLGGREIRQYLRHLARLYRYRLGGGGRASSTR